MAILKHVKEHELCIEGAESERDEMNLENVTVSSRSLYVESPMAERLAAAIRVPVHLKKLVSLGAFWSDKAETYKHTQTTHCPRLTACLFLVRQTIEAFHSLCFPNDSGTRRQHPSHKDDFYSD